MQKYSDSPSPKLILHYLRQRTRINEEDHIYYEYRPHVERAYYAVDPEMRPAYSILSDFHSELPIFRKIKVYLEWDQKHHHWILTDNGNGEFESMYNNLNISGHHRNKYGKIFSDWLRPLRIKYRLHVNELGDYYINLNDLTELQKAFWRLIEFDIIITNTASLASYMVEVTHRPKHLKY